MTATEAGPPGFLPAGAGAAGALLAKHGLTLVGGFVTAVLHDAERRTGELAAVERQAAWLAACGAEVLVLAAATGRVGYSAAEEIGDAGWRELLASLDGVDAIARRYGLVLAVHPHFGTVIERAADVERFLTRCAHGLCLDTGHLVLGGADPLRIAALAGRRMRHVHLKDVDPELSSRVRDRRLDYAPAVRRGLFCELGEGGARIGELLALLRAAAYTGWYVLEQDVMLDAAPEGIPPHVRRNVAFARNHG